MLPVPLQEISWMLLHPPPGTTFRLSSLANPQRLVSMA